MNTEYTIDILLNLPFTQENIQLILQKISTAGFTYLANAEDRKSFNINTRYFTLDQAILKMLPIVETDLPLSPSIQPSLHLKYLDAKFFLSLYKTENKLIKIRTDHFDPLWDKYFGFEKVNIIDFNRYIQLFLNTLSHITLLQLSTHSSSIDTIRYTDQQCITALINMGAFNESTRGNFNDIKQSLESFKNNSYRYNFIFFYDENSQQPSEICIQKSYDALKVGQGIYMCAKKDNFPFKIIIKRDLQQGCDFISLYPIKPYCMKKSYNSTKETIDVAFYVERLLEFCEGFAIYELRTFL